MSEPDGVALEMAEEGKSLFQVADLLYMNRRYRLDP
jgi:hypothetical protein